MNQKPTPIRDSIQKLRRRAIGRAAGYAWNLRNSGRTSLAYENSDPAKRAKHLFVKVIKWGDVIAEIQLPCRSVDSLEELISADLLKKIELQGFNVAEIKKLVQVSGYTPQEVIHFKSKEKECCVWLA